MRNRAVGAALFIAIFLLSFRFFFYIDGNIGHNWDWSFPSLSLFYENIKDLSIYTWDSYNLGFVTDLRIAHLVQNLFFSFIGPLVSIKIFLFSLFLGITALSFYGFKKLLDQLVNESSLNYIPSILFAFSPFLFNDIIGGSWVMWVSYAFSPIYLIFTLRYFKTGSPKYLLCSLLVSVFVMIALQHMLLINLLLYLYLFNEVFILRTESFVSVVKRSVLFFGLMFLINLYWILPFSSTIFDFTKQTVLSDGGSHEFDAIRNSRQSFWNILNLGGYFDRNMYLFALPRTLKNIFYVSVLLAWVAIAWSFVKEKRRIEKQKIAFWLVSLLVLIILIKGGNRPFSGFTLWLYESLPLMKMFRSPQHWMFVPAFIVPVLLALALNSFYYTSRYKRLIVAGFTSIVLIWIGGWWFNGDLGHKTLMDQRRDFIDFYRLDPVLVQYYENAQNNKSDYRSFFLPAVHSPTYLKTENQNSASGYQPDYLYLNKPTMTTESNEFAREVENSFCDEDNDLDYVKYLSLFSVEEIILRSDIYPLHAQSVRCWNSNSVKESLDSNAAIESFLSGEYTTAYRVKKTHTLAHIYSAPEVSIVAGRKSSLVPFLRTSYLDSFPALAFTEQQDRVGLQALFADRNKAAIDKRLLFANSDYNDLIVSMAKAGLSKTGPSQADGQGGGVVELDGEGRGSISVEQEGEHGIWVGGAARRIDLAQAVTLGADVYTIEKQDGSSLFRKVGSKYLKKGKHEVRLTDKDEGSIYQRPEVVLISSEKHREFEELLRSREIRYLSFKERGQGLSAEEIGSFYVSASGEYEVSALFRPKSRQGSVHAFNEQFKEDYADVWNLRLEEGEHGRDNGLRSGADSARLMGREGGGSTQSPVFIFGNNFSPLSSYTYPLAGGMWRWMSNNGTVFLFNPYAKPVKADVSLLMASFGKSREAKIALNNKLLKTVTLPEPKQRLQKEVAKTVTNIRWLANESGKPMPVDLKGVVLRPGLNEIGISAAPGAEVTGQDGRFRVSIAVRDDISVKLVGEEASADAALWSNKKTFRAGVKDEELLINDVYGGREGEAAWITRRLPSIDIADYPNFTLVYSVSDRFVQAMEVGFRIDTDGDGEQDIYFVRTVPAPPSTQQNLFEMDLKREIRKSYPALSVKTASLVGVDFFPHKQWILGASDIDKSIYTYTINSMQITSARVAQAVLGEGTLAGAEFAGAFPYRISSDKSEFLVTVLMGASEGWSRYGELRLPLRGELLGAETQIVLPFRNSWNEYQNIRPWVGYDTTGDGGADEFIPVGLKASISGWKLREKYLKNPFSLYEAKLSKVFFDKFAAEGGMFEHITVLKDNEPLASGLDVNTSLVSRESFNLVGDKIVVNLPLGVKPEDSQYKIYYSSKDLIRDSVEFVDFKEYLFEPGMLKENAPESTAKPVELRLELEAKNHLLQELSLEGWMFKVVDTLLSQASRKDMAEGDGRQRYNYHIKAPVYVSSVLSRLENIEQSTNLPFVKFGSKVIEFNEQEIDNEKEGVWYKSVLSLEQGHHLIRVDAKKGLETEILEIRPAVKMRKSSAALAQVDYEKVNPTKYIVNVKGAPELFNLVFSENFHRGWKAYLRHEPDSDSGDESWSALWSALKDRGERVEVLDHIVVNGYANGWIVDTGGDSDFQIVLEFSPQRLFEAGVLVSALVLIGCVGYWGYGCRRRRDENSEN